eukprot:m.244993 g.244993  ORF g.244993 m.244993 type:complete len:117 (-) comp22566_c2_seq1:70-420(-)
MPWKPVEQPKCPTCGKTAYPAESISAKEKTYHKICFKCCECDLRLTLTTYKVSDFGQDGIFCHKCVPKIAPSQTADTVDVKRNQAQNALTKSVKMVNEQVRGAPETIGMATNALPT